MIIKRNKETYEVKANEKKWRVSSGVGKARVIYEVTKVEDPARGGLATNKQPHRDVSKAVKMCWSLTRSGGVVICHELSLWKEINTKQRGYIKNVFSF